MCTPHGIAAEVPGGGEVRWLAEWLFGATGGTAMIGTRVHMVNEDGSFTTVVCAESLQGVEQTAKARYPELAFRNPCMVRAG